MVESGLAERNELGPSTAIALEQLDHLRRRKLGGVPGLELSSPLAGWIEPQGSQILGGSSGQSLSHGAVVARIGDRSTTAGLHPMGGLMGQGVPDSLGVAVHPADHDRVAAVVVDALQSSLVAVALHHLDP